ncbi:copper amine oxidase N-terminal domain-containing protein [Paenibacillus sp. 1001270B_150601_E10]|uniref:copper amine oxidase N-terminal domain-containing protein n=1 Tax=Paenibacillus sp. 1001270B_150601_E10 TaxID=2787079 RepID=UPI00189DCA80|nr:copper amine oxidase N-terminal domain-containing protein [Paenibacillus sp. 1001270B_150601_E10]
MKKRFMLVLSMLLMSLTIAGFGAASEASAKAASEKPKIVNVLDENHFLLDDGTFWGESSRVPWKVSTSFVDIQGSAKNSYGITSSGKVYSYELKTMKELPYMKNVAQIGNNGYWLKNDGTLWQDNEQFDDVSNIKMFDYQDGSFAVLSKDGDLEAISSAWKEVSVLGKVSNVRSIAVADTGVVVVQDNGQATHYSIGYKANEQKLIASDVAQAMWQNGRVLLLVKSDGTVWRGEQSSKFDMKQLTGLTNVKKIVNGSGISNFVAQRQDGSWVHYRSDGRIQPLEAPALSNIKLIVSKSQAKVGDHFTIEVEEEYTNGYKAKRVPTQEELTIDQPQLIERMANNQFKMKAVGEATITVTVNGVSEQAKIFASANKQLQYASNIKGLVYLPVKPVFETIGGSVAYDAKTKGFTIQLGQQKIAMKKDSKIATVNGKQITMGGVVQERGGQMVFSSDLLKNMLGAKTTWDDKLKTATVNFGSAKLVVISQDTEKAVKKQQVGNLSKYIGKTYWVDDFQNWERFMKITVTDIIPKTDPYGDVLYIIQFKNAKGATLKTSQMGASSVEAHLTAGDTLLNYNPYTRYNWSNKTWDLIKKRKVALGMTKEQVLMSWGSPDHKSSAQSNGIVVESWGYGTYSLSIITFTNGKVSNLYQ